MTVVFVSYRIHWIQWKLESVWQCFSFPTWYIEYSEIRIGMRVVPVSHWTHWMQRKFYRFDSGPRFPPSTLNTVRSEIGVTVVFVSYRRTMNSVIIRIGLTVVLVSHRLHWIQWQLESVWELSFSFFSFFFFCLRIHSIQSEFESVCEWSSLSRYAEYNEN